MVLAGLRVAVPDAHLSVRARPLCWRPYGPGGTTLIRSFVGVSRYPYSPRPGGTPAGRDRRRSVPIQRSSRVIVEFKSHVFARLGLAAVLALGASSAAVAQEQAEPAANAAKVESIDFRKLKGWLPGELNGIKRKEAGGEKNKVGEMTVSTARATYEKGGGDDEANAPRIELEIIDYGGIKDMAQGMAAVWTAAEIDKESDEGYERTIKVNGHPGMETWQAEGKHGEIQLLVGKRYILTLRTDNVPAEQVKKIAESLDLKALADLK